MEFNNEEEIDFSEFEMDTKKVVDSGIEKESEMTSDAFEDDIGFENKELIIELKSLLSSDCTVRKDSTMIIDCSKFLEDFNLLYDWFLKNPRVFINMVKEEIFDRYNVKFTIGLINLDVDEQISNIRVEHIKKIIKFKGIVGKATGIKILIKERVFECVCGARLKLQGASIPKGCSCGAKDFGEHNVVSTVYQDMQELDIEESQDDIDSNQPQRIRVRLLDELTNRDFKGLVQPGNKIEVIGIVEPIPANKANKNTEDIYEHRIFGLHINSLDEVYEDESSEEDLKIIRGLAAREDILELMGKSLAPEIHGQNDVKQSIVLQALGGTEKKNSDGKPIRNAIHIFLVGDAGVSKTVLLRSIQKRVGKAYYQSGEGATAAGLTAAVEKDELLGNWGVKAGAIPKASGGMALLDELDKADEKAIQSLHTPLESGIVTISKAGINTTLRANCSVLAAANPHGGRFDRSRPLVAQIKMSPTLLSRFDIVQIMQDVVDEENDSNIVDIIMNGMSDLDIVPVDIFRKYISYAKRLRPKMNKSLISDLKDFYNKVRRKSVELDSNMEGMPITPRHLLGIIRLSEAHAKLRLSTAVEQVDLDKAKKLYYDALLKIGMDDEGRLDMARVTGGVSATKKAIRQEVIKAMTELKDGGLNIVDENDLIEIMEKLKVDKDKTMESLLELKKIPEVYTPRNGFWSLV